MVGYDSVSTTEVFNEKTVKDAFPLPRVDYSLVELREVNVITHLDLMQGYHQVRVAEEDVRKTAFQGPDGVYELVVMSYGLTNAPATFQRLMNNVLAPFLHEFVIVYLYDICVYSSNPEEYLEHLRIFFELLRKYSLKPRLRKCTFAQTKTIYSGLMVGNGKVCPDPEKIKVVKNWPLPSTQKEPTSFVQFCSYFGRFINKLNAQTKTNDRPKYFDVGHRHGAAPSYRIFAKAENQMTSTY